MDRSRVAIVIPAYNEVKTIQKVVEETSLFGVSIVVNDSSSDGTGLIAESAGAIVINNVDNYGYEQSLDIGFRKAKELGVDIIITFDADGQHNIKYVKDIISLFKKDEIDLVLGYRNKYARISETIFSIYTKYRFKITDPLCGLKGYRLPVYEELGYFDKSKLIGAELMLSAVNKGRRFVELPIVINNRHDKSRFGSMILGNSKIMRALIFCMYKYG